MTVHKQSLFLVAVAALMALAGQPALGVTYDPTYLSTIAGHTSELAYHIGYVPGSLLGDWAFTGNGGSAGTTFADGSGNNHTATLYGTDTVTSTAAKGYPAAPVGGGLYFNYASGTSTYVGVPYSSSFGGMNDITLSAWVYFPSSFTKSNFTKKTSVFSMWNESGGTQCYQFGFPYLASGSTVWQTFQAPNNANEQYYWVANAGGTVGPFAAPGTWQLWTVRYDGGTNGLSAVGDFNLSINGVSVTGGSQNGPGTGNSAIPIPTAAVNQLLKLAGGANEWVGGLADLAIWNCSLSGTHVDPSSVNDAPLTGIGAGETAALYNTPMSGQAALAHYGAKAMDQLFTAYTNQSASVPVTVDGDTLTWQYVASGLPGASGSAGLVTSGPYAGSYYVNLDDAGGGVVTAPTPEPCSLALLAAGMIGILAYAWRKRK